jgi:stage II sporulation protein D
MARLRLLQTVIALAVAAGCVNPRALHPTTFAAPEVIRVRTDGRIQTVSLEDYVLGSALSELTPVGSDPAAVTRIFEVQTVLARTYAVARLGRHQKEGFDLCDATHCQLYQPARIKTSRFAEAARRAVERTRGVVLTFSRLPAEALFHSDCGGHTASADAVWGGAHVPYLTGAPDHVPSLSHRTWTFDAPVERVRAVLNLAPRSAVGRRLDRIAVTRRDESGRAREVQVRGDRTQTLRGEDLRSILNSEFGARAIMSTRVSIERRGSTYHFSGTGFGHGVGLCQTGAAARAARGEAVADILAVYYPGAALARVGSLSSRLAANLVGREVPGLLRSP